MTTAFAIKRPEPIDEIISNITAYAETLGVSLIAEYLDEQGYLTFVVSRTGGAPGNGAVAIRYLARRARESNLDVSIDVAFSEPRLIRYYWQFGFRLLDGSCMGEEEAELEKIEQERALYLERNGSLKDYGVTTMSLSKDATFS